MTTLALPPTLQKRQGSLETRPADPYVLLQDLSEVLPGDLVRGLRRTLEQNGRLDVPAILNGLARASVIPERDYQKARSLYAQELESVTRLDEWQARYGAAWSANLSVLAGLMREQRNTLRTAARDAQKNVVQLGVATDGLPVLLDLENGRIGPLAILGDEYSRKQELLQAIGCAALAANPLAGALVITRHPRSWSRTPRMTIFRDDSPLPTVCQWIRDWRADPRTALLLVDSPELIGDLESFRFVCQNGPAVRLWPLVAARSPKDLPAAHLFRARILGTPERAKPGQFAIQEGRWTVTFTLSR